MFLLGRTSCGIRQLTRDKKVIFILDEVITGFRVAPGGFQAICDIQPDLSTFAKVLAGGLPGGVLGGRADLMQALAFGNPLGKKMKHPGTYNGNPLSAAAGIAALEIVSTGQPNRRANEIASLLRGQLNTLFAEKGVNWIAYGDYSAIKILPNYDGPRSTSDDFLPHGGDWRKLDAKQDAALSQAFRCAAARRHRLDGLGRQHLGRSRRERRRSHRRRLFTSHRLAARRRVREVMWRGTRSADR